MPILVDESGGIIAGHGRVLAAESMGLDDAPTMTARGWSEAKRRVYMRERTCIDCGAVDLIRRDSDAERCKSCASRRAGAKGLIAIKARSRVSTCEACGNEYRGRNKRFCSRGCKNASATLVNRTCKKCGKPFSILSSVLKTNASGNFCCRPCYESFLCRTSRITGRGSQWRKARDEAIRRAPFCAMCGTARDLQVHHVIPFRLTRDNGQSNLVPLCRGHHRLVETVLVGTEEFGFGETEALVWQGMLWDMQRATAMKLKSTRPTLTLP